MHRYVRKSIRAPQSLGFRRVLLAESKHKEARNNTPQCPPRQRLELTPMPISRKRTQEPKSKDQPVPLKGWQHRLRQELSARNSAYAASQRLPHVFSYGEMPVVVYEPFPEAVRHGNFLDATYAAILSQPEWGRRLEKIHSQASRSPALRRQELIVNAVNQQLNPERTSGIIWPGLSGGDCHGDATCW